MFGYRIARLIALFFASGSAIALIMLLSHGLTDTETVVPVGIFVVLLSGLSYLFHYKMKSHRVR